MKLSPAGKTTFILLTLLLTGCAAHREAWNKIYGIPVNSTVAVMQPLTIPVRDTQVFIQEATSRHPQGIPGSYNSYYPFCYFEVADISNAPQSIEPGTFTITAVRQDETEIIARAGPGRLVVQPSIGGQGDAGLRMIYRMFEMRLHSDEQPQVKKLVCSGGFDIESWAKLPKLKEIEQALGNVARLELAPADK